MPDKAMLAVVAVAVAMLAHPGRSRAESILENCHGSVANLVACTVIEQGVSRLVDMTLSEFEKRLRGKYSSRPAPGPLQVARCSVTCGQIHDSPPETKPTFIQAFFEDNCQAAGFSLSGAVCARP